MDYHVYPGNLINYRLNSYQKFFSGFFLKKTFDYFNLFELVFCMEKTAHGGVKIETREKEERYAIILSKNLDLILGSRQIRYYMKGWKENETFISNENHFGSEIIISFSFDPELGGKTRLFSYRKKVYSVSNLIFYKIKEYSISFGSLFFLTIFPELFQKRSWYKIKKENTRFNSFEFFETPKKKKKTLENLNKQKIDNFQVFIFFGGKPMVVNQTIPNMKKIFWINFNVDETFVFLLNRKVSSNVKRKVCEEVSKKTVGFLFYEMLYEAFFSKNYSNLKEILSFQGFFVIATPYEGNSIENFVLNLTQPGLISKKKIYSEFKSSPIIEYHSLENFELIFKFECQKKKLMNKSRFWSNFNLFLREFFAKFFFVISENFFFTTSKKKFSFLLTSKGRFLLVSKFFGQVKVKQEILKKEGYEKFSRTPLLKNRIQFSTSGQAKGYSSLGKFKI